MQAIIIAAGRDSRLNHHAEHQPKAMIPILGRPILDYQLEILGRYGISDLICAEA